MATRYVDVDAEVGGDGTTNGLTGGTCAYKSINIWEAARQADLTSSATETCICESSHASHTADTTAVTIAGWTTVAANYIEIKTSTGARHAGVWSDSKYRISAANANTILIQEEYVRLDGLQVAKSASSASDQVCIVAVPIGAPNDLRVSNCIVRQAGNNSYREACIYFNDTDIVFTLWNTICYGGGTATGDTNAAVVLNVATANVYGCTLIGGVRGLHRVGGTVTVKNTYAYGTTSGFNGTITSTYCASNTTELSGTEDIDSVAYSTDNFVSVTPGNADYLKMKSGGALHEQGTTLSDDPPGSTALGVDIAGNARS